MSRATRIGFLVDSLLSRYQVRLFNAVRRPAQRCGAVVLGFPGSYLVGADPNRPIFDGSFIFDLVGPECVDGLIVASSVLLSGAGAAKIHAICAHAQVPVVSIGPLPGIPSVDIDNLCGLRRVIEHLVEHHGKRQLAFIRGPITNPDSLDRERVFRATLQDIGIEPDPDLIVTGNFLEASGAAAVRTLLDERRLEKRLDAIVAANDQMAAGAIRELRSRGLRVPEDLAVVGFDDDEHARSTNPPLTTVAQPICRLGEVAVSLLLDRIRGVTTQTSLRLETVPVWRRSCGCAQGAEVPVDGASPEKAETGLEERCNIFADQFTRTVGFRNARRGIDLALDIVATENAAELKQKQHEFEQVVREAASQGVDPLEWEDVLGPLRATKERAVTTDPSLRLDVSVRSQSIHWLLAELSARARLEDQLRTLEYANALRVVGSAVVCARHFRALTRVLEAGLPALDVRFCCVCVFTNEERTRGRVAALYDPAEPKPHDQLHSAEQLWRAIPPTLPPGHFPSSTHLSGFPTNAVLPPSALYSSQKDLLVYPLVFAEDALGYVVVDAPDDVQRAWLLEGLSGHLSSAVYEIARTNELHAARELAEEASSAKSAFVAMMSHEVRTPLNAVIGNVDLCLRTELTREQRRYLERAQTSSRALLGIVNDILDFSRIEAERVEIERLPFELEEVLEQVIVSCSAEAAKKDLELILDVGSDVPFALVGDSLRLMQVLVNLVNNAVKFSSQGHVAVRINAVEADPGTTASIHFQVEDTGIGMSSAQLERIFRPFTQADNSITRRYGGTGLGLTICQQLVGLLGGELSVQSQPGVGSIFEFSLPLPAATNLPEPQGPTDIQVVVAEAHELQSEALSRLLTRYVHGICVARSGIAALAALRDTLASTPVQRVIAFVSSQLPDMDGAVLCQRIRELDGERRTTVVLLVPYDAETLLLHGWHQAGVDVVLAKPLQRSGILRVLGRSTGVQPPDSEPVAFPSLRGKRVLVVQDSELSRELARDLLVHSGAEVLFAGDGLEAVTVCEQEPLDLVLMDLNLPRLDGCGATRLIRKQSRRTHLPILALSASGDRSDRQRCLDAGMDDFIRAPIGATQLVSTIHKWCQPTTPVRLPNFKAHSSSTVRRASVGPTPTLEVARALRRLGGNAALYRKLLQRFVASFERSWSDWKRAESSEDPREAAALVHTIVSAAGNIGASRLQQISQALESSLRCGASALIAIQQEHFEAELVEAIDAAKRALAQPDGTSRPPPSTRVGDIEQRLHSLRLLLNEHDTAAVELVEALGDFLVEDAQSSEALRRLAQSVAAYDFESATLQLDRLTDALKLQTSDAHDE